MTNREEIKDCIRASLVFGTGIFSNLRSEGLEIPPDNELFYLIQEVEQELKERELKCLNQS